MKVDDLLDDLSDLLDDAKDMPILNKAMIDKTQIADIIDEIRKNLPVETRQAKAIVADRTKIINDAKAEADAIISIAEKKRNEMLAEDKLVIQANVEAKRIVSEANLMAQKVRNATNHYIDEILVKTDELLTSNLEDFKRKRAMLEKAKSKQKKPGDGEEAASEDNA